MLTRCCSIQRARPARRPRLSRSFDCRGLGAITRRLCLQVFDGFVVADLVRDLQTKFRLGAEVLRVTHALSPSSAALIAARGELIAAQLHFFFLECGAGISGILKAYGSERRTFCHVPYIAALFQNNF